MNYRSASLAVYGGTAVLSGLLYGAYYFGNNLVWKDSLQTFKKEIIEHQRKTNEHLCSELKGDIQELEKDVEGMNTEMKQIRGGLNSLKTDIQGLNTEIKQIQVVVNKINI